MNQRETLARAQQARRDAIHDLRDATEDEEDTKRLAVLASVVAHAVRQSSADLDSEPPAAKPWRKVGKHAKTGAAVVLALGAVGTLVKALIDLL